MARKRNWDALTDAYRHRMIRNGITRQDYESGASLTAARGHGLTPENTMDAARHPDKFDRWFGRQAKKLGFTKDETVDRAKLRLEPKHKWNAWSQLADPKDTKLGGEYETLFKAARDSGWSTDKHGPWAKLLKWLGIKDQEDYTNVGDTP